MTFDTRNPLPPEAFDPAPGAAEFDSMSMLAKLDLVCDQLAEAITHWSRHQAAQAEPPERTHVRLTTARPFYQQTSGKVCLSVGVRNAGNVPVFLSIGGETPRRGTGAVEIPAGALVVIPTGGRDIALAVDDADLASVPAAGFSVDVYRYWTVQPASAYHLPVTVVTGDGGDGGTP